MGYPFYTIQQRKGSKRAGVYRYEHVTETEWLSLGDSKARWLEWQRIRNRRKKSPEELAQVRQRERERYSDPDFRDRHNAKRRARMARLRVGRPKKKPGRKPKSELVTNEHTLMTAAQAQERSEAAKARVQGSRDRQRLIDALLEVLTSDAADSQTLQEAKACNLYFPEGRELIEKICRVYGDKPDLFKTVLLSAVVNAIEKLI